jgi:hypothetical protein
LYYNFTDKKKQIGKLRLSKLLSSADTSNFSCGHQQVKKNPALPKPVSVISVNSLNISALVLWVCSIRLQPLTFGCTLVRGL